MQWLPVRRHMELNILTLMFKIKMGTAPTYPFRPGATLSVIQKVAFNRETLFSSTIYSTKDWTRRAFQMAGPTLWNGMP